MSIAALIVFEFMSYQEEVNFEELGCFIGMLIIITNLDDTLLSAQLYSLIVLSNVD